jgi:hypothetical protein
MWSQSFKVVVRAPAIASEPASCLSKQGRDNPRLAAAARCERRDNLTTGKE